MTNHKDMLYLTKIINTTNGWTEAKMLKELKNGITSFESGIGSYRMQARVTITIEKLPAPPMNERKYAYNIKPK